MPNIDVRTWSPGHVRWATLPREYALAYFQHQCAFDLPDDLPGETLQEIFEKMSLELKHEIVKKLGIQNPARLQGVLTQAQEAQVQTFLEEKMPFADIMREYTAYFGARNLGSVFAALSEEDTLDLLRTLRSRYTAKQFLALLFSTMGDVSTACVNAIQEAPAARRAIVKNILQAFTGVWDKAGYHGWLRKHAQRQGIVLLPENENWIPTWPEFQQCLMNKRIRAGQADAPATNWVE